MASYNREEHRSQAPCLQTANIQFGVFPVKFYEVMVNFHGLNFNDSSSYDRPL